MKRSCAKALVTAAACCVVVMPLRPAAQAPSARAAGIYTAEQAKRGAPLYAEHCAPCHGVNLAGSDFGPGLTDRDLLSRWSFRSVGELFGLMQSTMPVNSPGGLSVEQNAAILAFLFQRAKFPAGTTELTGRMDVLNGIKLGGLAPERDKK